MKKIILSLGKYRKQNYTLVDDEDYEYLYKNKWHVNEYGYVQRIQWVGKIESKNRIKKIFLHREILRKELKNKFEKKEVDHINGDKLDNRKCNLRICNHQQNRFNNKLEIRNTSGYKGVYWNKRRQKWLARVEINDKKISLGAFDNKLDAAKAYNIGAIKYFGEFAKLND